MRLIIQLIKKVLKKIGGRTKRCYRKVTNRFFSMDIECDVRELFFQQNGACFNRYDIIVRYLAVEDYYGFNTYGFDLYKKMQAARVSKEWVDASISHFERLIRSYDKKGYDKTSQIELDKNLNLIDGSHRIAMALYHKSYTISCKLRPNAYDIFYGIEWFIENGFTVEEIRIIQNKYRQIHDAVMVPFVCTLWPPVQEYFDEITAKLSLMGTVVTYYDFEYDDFTFKAIARGIYAVDDIEKWKIDMKIDKMSPTPIKKVRYVLLNLENPRFRLKSSNNHTLSITCERIKKAIRSAYKNKIDNYFYDIIMHIGDNYYQNTYIQKLFNVSLDVKGALDAIAGYRYAISKMEVPYMPQDFPTRYPLGKDIDILCLKSDYKQIVKVLHEYVGQSEATYNVKVVKKHTASKEEYRTLIRIELDSFLLFMFDIFYKIDNASDDFVDKLVGSRINNGAYYSTSPDCEYAIRLNEIFEYPNKKHHKEYLTKHRADLDTELCERFLKFNWKQCI